MDKNMEEEHRESLVSFATMMRREGMDVEAIKAALLETNKGLDPVLPQSEVEEIAGGIVQSIASRLRAISRMDLGNAERLVKRHGKNLRCCLSWKKWLVWDGTHWHEDVTGKVTRFAKDTVRKIRNEIPLAVNQNEERQIAWHARQSGNSARIKAMIELAQSEPEIAITPGQLDTDPWLLNVLNGTIDLRTGNLREHRRKDLITKLIMVNYYPEAKCPQWEAFLAQIMGNSQELIRYLQRTIGYALTGLTKEQVVFILYGERALKVGPIRMLVF